MNKQHRYYLRHPERVKERVKRYWKAHPEKVKEWKARHYQKHRKEILARVKSKYQENRQKILKRAEEYRKKNREKLLTKSRERLLKKYGLTPQEYENLLIVQEYKCAICEILFSEKIILERLPSIDHCHDSGKVRGLLCMNCNAKLGILENKLFVQKAERYLKESLSK